MSHDHAAIERFEPPPGPYDRLEIHVSIRHTRPAVWRRLVVPATTTLAALHRALQAAFGWKDYHLHEFVCGDVVFGDPETADDTLVVDERAAPLGAFARRGSRFVYVYDFGDDWEHDVEVERVDRPATADAARARDAHRIICVDGARACPPEDCGGPGGYEELIAALADREHEEHAASKRWVGRGFDPEKLDLLAINRRLASLSSRRRRR